MIRPDQFMKHFIAPALKTMARVEPRIDSPAARNLLLGTAIQESRLKYLDQHGDRPDEALSFFQIEPATFRDVFERYVPENETHLLPGLHKLLMPGLVPIDQLAGNTMFACAIARVRYWMSPLPLPMADDIDALGVYWKSIYNTAGGAGTAAEFSLHYRKFVR